MYGIANEVCVDVGAWNGRVATGTDEGVRAYTSYAESCLYFAALATFTPLEEVA
jgi:hypothetical protein